MPKSGIPQSSTCTLAAFIFASGSLSGVRAQSSPDYGPFDPARIGLPALTEQGIDRLIEQHRKLVEEGRKAIADLQAKQPPPANAEAVIQRYQETIRRELAQIARLAGQRTQTATELANAGRVADLPALRTQLTTVLEASRFNALLGNEKEALKQWQAAVQILQTFTGAFSATCRTQSFDPGIARALQRQNDMLGTGFDVTGCDQRLHTFEVDVEGYHVEWRNCGFGGEGKWWICASNCPDPGARRSGCSGTANVSVSGEVPWHFEIWCSGAYAAGMKQDGKMKLIVHEERAQDGSLVKRDITAKVFTNYQEVTKRRGPIVTYPRTWTDHAVKIGDKPCEIAEDR